MVRIVWICTIGFLFAVYYLIRMTVISWQPEGYSTERRYRIARHIIWLIKTLGLVRTKVYGKDNLPKEGGYVMTANHQGKYDVVGIIYGHAQPCTFVVDEKRSRLFYMDQFTDLIEGIRLNRGNIREQVKTIMQIAEKIKNGRRVIIFPEGGYDHNRNEVMEFMPGAFKCATKSKRPIIPVALIDSYRVFGINSLLPVSTQVHFLPPISYEQYKEMNTTQIAALVREQIRRTIRKYA